MKDKDNFELDLQKAFSESSDWHGSKETMWKNIEERLPERKKRNKFRNTSIAAGTLVAAILCIGFFGKAVLVRFQSTGNIWGIADLTHHKGRNGPIGGDMIAPIYLNWNINANLKDDICMPGQDIKLEITITGVEENIKITEKVPSIIITRIGKTYQEEKIGEIPLPQLKDRDIRKGEVVNVTVNYKAPNEPGLYQIAFGEMRIQHKEGATDMSGGGTRFTVLASKSDVYIKSMDVNKEINAQGNIIKIKSITMNEKQTTINYTTESAQQHGYCRFNLKTDKRETLYEINWVGKDTQNGAEGWVSFNPVPRTAEKLILQIYKLNETTADGIKEIQGDWSLEIPLN